MSDFHPGSWNPAWSVATILTGLLSFMLSDEMTTGSMTSSDADKRAFAATSHSWNLKHKGFTEMFPDFCTESLKDLPNMGEKERGKPDVPPEPRTSPEGAIAAAASTSATSKVAPANPAAAQGPAGAPGTGWLDLWRKLIFEKWRWGVLIAVAVIVSRLSS